MDTEVAAVPVVGTMVAEAMGTWGLVVMETWGQVALEIRMPTVAGRMGEIDCSSRHVHPTILVGVVVFYHMHDASVFNK